MLGVDKRVRARPSKTASTTSRAKPSPPASNASGAAKRSRTKPKLSASASISDGEEEKEEEDEPPRKADKKPRKSASTAANGSANKKRVSLAALDKTDDDDDDVEMISDTASNRRMGSIHGTQPKDPTIYSTMKELNMHTLKNWEDIIMNINTVEQVKDSGLMVYFTTYFKKEKFLSTPLH